MQVCASHPDAWSDRTPHRIEVDLGEEPPAVVQNPLISHTDRSRRHRIAKAQRLERTHTVGGEVDAGSRRRPGRCALDDLCGDPARTQGAAKRESRDSCAHDSTDGGSDKERFVGSAAGIGAASLRQPRYYGWARRVVACLRRFFARECSNEECSGASHWNPDTLVTPVAFMCGASLFSRNNENEERAHG